MFKAVGTLVVLFIWMLWVLGSWELMFFLRLISVASILVATFTAACWLWLIWTWGRR